VFPVIYTAQIAVELVCTLHASECKAVTAVGGVRGLWRKVARCHVRPSTVCIVALSWLGMALWLAGNDNGRAVLSGACLVVFTYSRHFRSMVRTLSVALLSCLPFMATMLVIFMAFALIFIELYGETPTINGPYFSHFGLAMIYMFRLFVGEGWYAIMYDIAYHSSLATMALFMAYVFCSTLLFGQLVLGVIISVYDEVTTFNSPMMYATLAPLYRTYNTTDQGRLVEDLVTVNYDLMGVHTLIQELSDSDEHLTKASSQDQ